MNKIRKGITCILNGLAGISFIAMVALTCWQVLTRYVHMVRRTGRLSVCVDESFGSISRYAGARTHEYTDPRRTIWKIGTEGSKLSGRVDRVFVFCHHSCFWRGSDYNTGNGADDFFAGSSDRNLLYSTSALRGIKYDLYGV